VELTPESREVGLGANAFLEVVADLTRVQRIQRFQQDHAASVQFAALLASLFSLQDDFRSFHVIALEGCRRG
jgi:hypothetical protein